jgi:endonuclease/exonuclease/phosphatase family metal-dependent hydrolase
MARKSSNRDGVPLMGATLMKLATWNMGGGILGKSHQRDGSPSLEYYASVLREHRPDVICLQEAHDYRGRQAGQSEYLASRLGYPYVESFPLSESHMANDAFLALGILSRFPIKNAKYKQFPNAGLEAAGPDGDYWKLHDKGYVVGTIDLDGKALGFMNGHCFPLSHFGASPTEPRFERVWGMLTEDLLALAAVGPAFAAIDLNHEPVQELLKEALRPGNYINAFEGTSTTPKDAQLDYLLYQSTIRLLSTTVKVTQSDHSYCQIRVLV